MGFFDKYREGSRDQIAKYAWALVITILKEVGEVALAELAVGLEEFRKQQKTPDGWTKEEYLAYAIGRLRIIQSREIGPFIVDELLDWAIERLVDVLEGKLAALDDDDAPVPPVVVKDPYYPTLYGPNDKIDETVLRTGDKVYKKGLDRFVIPVLFSETPLYRQAVENATLIDVIGDGP